MAWLKLTDHAYPTSSTVLPEACAPGDPCQPSPPASCAACPGRAGRLSAWRRALWGGCWRRWSGVPGARAGLLAPACCRPRGTAPGGAPGLAWRSAGAKTRPVEFLPRAPCHPLLARRFRPAPPPERAAPAGAAPAPAAPPRPSA